MVGGPGLQHVLCVKNVLGRLLGNIQSLLAVTDSGIINVGWLGLRNIPTVGINVEIHLFYEFLSQYISHPVPGRSILISDFLTDNDFFNAIDHLRSKKRDVLCLQVLSEEELHPQIRGKSIIRDSEDMGRFYKDNIGRDMLEAYRKALKHVTKRLEDFCISREADYQLVSTKDELKDILLGQLMKKGVIK